MGAFRLPEWAVPRFRPRKVAAHGIMVLRCGGGGKAFGPPDADSCGAIYLRHEAAPGRGTPLDISIDQNLRSTSQHASPDDRESPPHMFCDRYLEHRNSISSFRTDLARAERGVGTDRCHG
jgi:hypothetical protein